MSGAQKRVPEVRFKGFTDDWEQLELSEVAGVMDGDRGKNYPSGDDFSEQGHTLFLSATNVTKDGFSFKSNQYITKEKSNTLGNGKLELNDIVLTSRGSLGHVAWYNNDIRSLVPLARINSGMLILRSKQDVEPGYIAQYLKSPLGKDKLNLISFGSAQPQLTKKDVSNYKLSIPKKAEQTQLSELFSKLDYLIALHQRKLDLFKQLKQACLQVLFPNENEKFPKVRIANFEGDWEQRELSEVMADFIVPMRDKPKEFSGDIPWARIEDVEGKYLNGSLSGQYVSKDTINKMNLKIIPKGSLIVSASATFGAVAIVTRDLITNQTFIGLVPERDYDLDFLYTFFQSPSVQKKMRLESAGSTIFYISKQTFENMKFPFPNYIEQRKVGKFFSNLDHLILLHQSKITVIKKLKSLYLQKMFC